MAITVADLVRIPHLRMRMIAGEGGASRKVAWAHASDLDAPWDWLAGDELLMKNGRTLPGDDTARVELLTKLAEVGASALVIGEDPDTPTYTQAFRDAADRLDAPVLAIPYSVSFVSVSRAVADANAQDNARRLARTERIYEVIRGAVTATDSLGLLGQLERELGCQLFLLDPASAHPVLEDSRNPTTELRAAVLRALHPHRGTIPAIVRVPLPPAGDAVAVDVPYAEPTLLVAARFSAGSIDVSLLEHSAIAVAVELVYVSLQRELERRTGTELFAHLVDTRLNYSDANSQLQRVGLEPWSAVVVDVREGSEQAWSDLHISLDRREIGHLLLRRGDDRLALVPDNDEALDVIQRRLGREARIGVSDTLENPLRMADAVKEARFALADADSRPDRRARYGGPTESTLLHDVGAAERLVDQVLGPLIAYDSEHGTDLVATTRAFLACRRSWQTTGAELHLHKQTVVYRIKRVEDLTGRALSETSDIATIWLALRARTMLEGSKPS